MKDLGNFAARAEKVLKECGIPYGRVESVMENDRFRTRWGDCGRIKGSHSFRIRINPVLLRDDVPEKALLETILHEYLHTCPGCQNHGTRWKQYAARINVRYGYQIKRCDSEEDKGIQKGLIKQAKRKYAIKCQHCGMVYRYSRKGKAYMHPEEYHCGRCGGKLTKTG